VDDLELGGEYQALGLERVFDDAAYRRATRHAQVRLAGDFFQADRPAPLQPVACWQHRDDRVLDHRADVKVLEPVHPRSYGKVGDAVSHVVVHTFGKRLMQLECDAGVRRLVGSDDGRQLVRGDRWRGADGHPAPPQARLLAQLVRHRFELVHHALEADEQGATAGRQQYAAGRTLEQRHPQFLFHLLHVHANDRLRAVQCFSRPPEARKLRDAKKSFDLAQVHF